MHDIYPNPASDMVTVKVKNGNGKEVELHDITGRLISTYKLKDNKAIINVNGIASGYYYLSVYHDNQIETKKLVISK